MKKIKKVQFFAEKSEKKPNFAAQKSKRELSSVGSEHRPYKAGVVGSSPTVPTKMKIAHCQRAIFLFQRRYPFLVSSLMLKP